MKPPFQSKTSEMDIPSSFMFRWNQPPNKLGLDIGQIHIWKVYLKEESSLADCQRILSTDDHLRASRMVIPEKRRRFQLARFALRKILSNYIDQSPESIQFEYQPGGKPCVLQTGKISPIDFNIAHSENLMVAAFTRGKTVGIDLEFNQPVSTKEWIVNRFFSKNDQVIYQEIPDTDKEIAFLTAWTKKEAYGKAEGTGLVSSSHMDHFNPGLNIKLPTDCYEISFAGAFWFLRFTPEEDFTAAAVIRSIDKPNPYFWVFSEIN